MSRDEDNSQARKPKPPESAEAETRDQDGVEKKMDDPDRQRDLDKRLRMLNDILCLRQFLGCSFEPDIRDAEIVVAFLDVRGFTNYCRTLQSKMQDRKIQHFLKTYVRIFNEGLMAWLAQQETHEDGELREKFKHVIPSAYKNLGDGLMIVWELEASLEKEKEGQLVQDILSILDEIMQVFYWRFRKLDPFELDGFSAEVEKLDIGCGVAKGHAWRLDYGISIDYAGSVINLASRLQDYARPRGMVAAYDVSTWMFDRHVAGEKGAIVDIEIKGYDTPIKAWFSRHVDATQEGVTIASARTEPQTVLEDD